MHSFLVLLAHVVRELPGRFGSHPVEILMQPIDYLVEKLVSVVLQVVGESWVYPPDHLFQIAWGVELFLALA